MALPDSLRDQIQNWINADPDPTTRTELEELLRNQQTNELAKRFSMPIGFGTAGIRALMGAGPSRINRATISVFASAVAQQLSERGRDITSRGVVVGYDGRHNSRELAEACCEVFAAHGIGSVLFDGPVPTPVVAFATHSDQRAAGLVITASHNAPEYNGCKVFWSNGAQVIPPDDEQIVERLPRIQLNDVRRIALEVAIRQGLVHVIDGNVLGAYVQRTCALHTRRDVHHDITIAYTALHGVGSAALQKVLSGAGFTKLERVAEQDLPAADFPTVRSPNPEDHHALGRVIELAKRTQAELILATDPDADRLAVAVPDSDGAVRILSGNEIGILLTYYLLMRSGDPPAHSVISTVVSSPGVTTIARALGAHAEETLTGFKWIMNRAVDIENRGGPALILGFEEALGFGLAPHVRDKDGISAALVVAEAAGWCKAQGRNLRDLQHDIWRRFGFYGSGQAVLALDTEQSARQPRLSDRIRGCPFEPVAGVRVVRFDDFLRQTSRTAAGEATPIELPRTDLIRLTLDDGTRVCVRPSGTEPKIKVYIDTHIPIDNAMPIERARALSAARIQRIADAYCDHASRPDQ